MEQHLWRTNYVRTLKANGGWYTSQSKQTGDAMLLRANKRWMLYFSEQNKRGCYTTESIHTGMLYFSEQNKPGCYTSQNIQTGDAMLLRVCKRGMLFFSEQNKRGCYTSESIQTGDAIFLRTKQTGMLYF